MKIKILLLALLLTCSLHAQTTHDLPWQAGSGTANDLTIDAGDTVRWTWTSSSHTVENTIGSSVEDFDSGFLGPIGSIFEHTFTAIGDNHYFCDIHGAASMSGTITVSATAGIDDEIFKTFSILPNPAVNQIIIKLPNSSKTAIIEVFNIIGKRILNKSLNETIDTSLNISAWQSGMYIIRVTSGENSQTKRFVKL